LKRVTLLGPQEREPIVYLRVSKESISTKRQSLPQSGPPFLCRCVRSTTVGRKGRSRLGHLHTSKGNRTLLQWDGFRARHPSPRTGSVLGLASRYGVDLDEGPIDQTLFPVGRKPCHTRPGRRAWEPTKSTQLDATRQTTATCAIPRRARRWKVLMDEPGVVRGTKGKVFANLDAQVRVDIRMLATRQIESNSILSSA